ncbi:hypothetical protein BU14_0178s0029 [Porphyra umbilicalis]|uniref:Uncharacterized protein n=1 Tax=Porphyra umbilicalis TaxID=2786 RepID=A0A1X6P7V9_PORUM|nr:hypothetical protein BU14_0178s0029 [Porphyra umbilicalis]|eukprot:OSX76713.1 hypothetical protein BU14_0178s0029 [Porphyra umbilicalis]
MSSARDGSGRGASPPPPPHGAARHRGAYRPTGRGSSCATSQQTGKGPQHGRRRCYARRLGGVAACRRRCPGAARGHGRGPDHHAPAHGLTDCYRRRHRHHWHHRQWRPSPLTLAQSTQGRTPGSAVEEAATAAAVEVAAAGLPAAAATADRRRLDRPACCPTLALAGCHQVPTAVGGGSTTPSAAADLPGRPRCCSVGVRRAPPRRAAGPCQKQTSSQPLHRRLRHPRPVAHRRGRAAAAAVSSPTSPCLPPRRHQGWYRDPPRRRHRQLRQEVFRTGCAARSSFHRGRQQGRRGSRKTAAVSVNPTRRR